MDFINEDDLRFMANWDELFGFRQDVSTDLVYETALPVEIGQVEVLVVVVLAYLIKISPLIVVVL